jgi:fatty acid desaturase
MAEQVTLPDANQGSAVTWLTSWIAILLMVVLLARTSWGRPIVYYALWLAVALLIFGHASELAGLISGKSNPNG